MCLQFHQELSVVNNLSESQPRTSLISALQDERKKARSLEKENNELRSAIEQHQQVLEIVMMKYREQSKQLARINRLELIYRIPSNDLDCQRYRYLQDKVNEMVLVLEQACETDDFKINSQQQLISKLTAENNRIKRLLLHK